MTSERPEPAPSEEPSPAAIAATEHPVQITVGLLEDDRVPEGMLCMGSYRNGRLIARAVLPLEAWRQIEEFGSSASRCRSSSWPGRRRRACSASSTPWSRCPDADEDDEEEPWSASVPGSSYESVVEEEDDREGEDDPAVAPIPLGNIVRFGRDRVHPESLPLEAVDVLRRIIDGETSEVVDRALSDLLGL